MASKPAAYGDRRRPAKRQVSFAMTRALDLDIGPAAGPAVIRFRGHPRDGYLCRGPMGSVRRRIAGIRDKLDLPRDASPEQLGVSLDSLRDLEVLIAELLRYNAAPWRELTDVAVAVRMGGRRHALQKLSSLAPQHTDHVQDSILKRASSYAGMVQLTQF